MKRLALLFALGAILLATVLTPAPARAALSFEDPQLCVNGKLLRVDPTTAGIEVWVRVGPDLTVSFDIMSCGGDPELPTLAADHVRYDGKKNWLEVAVQTEPHANVILYFDGQTATKKSGNDGWVYAKKKVK